MPRSRLAYLSDIVECCEAIEMATRGVSLAAYEANRLVRSAVEREFTIIGEAVGSLARLDPATAARLSHARKIIGFRNRLAHDYAAIDDATVWAIAARDVPVLRRECEALLVEFGSEGEAD